MSIKSEPLTFKDIAQITGKTVNTIKNNERRWGLDKSRIKVNARVVLFKRDGVEIAMRKLGYEIAP